MALSLPRFGTLPAVLRRSGLFATVPEHVAAASARQGGLRAEPLPFASPAYDLSVAWRAAADRDPAERWFRGALAASVGGGAAT